MSQTTSKSIPELRNPSVRLVLEETERNASLRHQAKAATAGVEGQSAIVNVKDRRLSGLERAKRFIEWGNARAFRDDLRSLFGTIQPRACPRRACAEPTSAFIATRARSDPIAQTWKLPLAELIASMLTGVVINVPSLRFG